MTRFCALLSVGLLATCAAAQAPCGGDMGGYCCSCSTTPEDDRCAVAPLALWCLGGLICGEELTCVPGEPIDIPEAQLDTKACGNPGQSCCRDEFCQPESVIGEGFKLECLLGVCVLPGDVEDESDDECGLLGAECCGAVGACTEELICLDGICQHYEGIDTENQPDPKEVVVEVEGKVVVVDAVEPEVEEVSCEGVDVPLMQPCCDQGCGPNANKTCSSGLCVSNIVCDGEECDELDDVIDQSSDGLEGANCIPPNNDCVDEDLLCNAAGLCEYPDDSDTLDQSSGCGAELEGCCSELDSPDPCLGFDLACKAGICMLADPPACSSPGQACCQGLAGSNTCSGEYLTCESDLLSPFADLCVRCGGSGESCCERASSDGATVEKYCASDTMPCVNGKCELYLGSCDSKGKGCCTNNREGLDYCVNEHTCNDTEEYPSCTRCGGGNAPCCFSSGMSLDHLPVADTSLFGQMCDRPDHACFLDSLDFSGLAGSCQHCGSREGETCCWKSITPTAFIGTRSDILMPVCPEPGLVCQGLLTIQPDSHLDYYKCVPAKEGTEYQAQDNENWCGGHSQACCPADTLAGKCSIGYTCNLSSIPGQDKCMPCGGDGQPCCFSPTPELLDPICSSGLGCSNTIANIVERSCSVCGGEAQPCCWEPLMGGYHCTDDGFECTGSIGVDQMCTAVEQ